MSPRSRHLVQLALFGFVLLGTASLREGNSGGVTQAIVWLPTGIAIAGLWLLGARACWVVALVAGLHRVQLGYGPLLVVTAAVASAAEAWVGVVLLRRFGLRSDFARLRDVVHLSLVAAIAPVASILVSALSRVSLGTFTDIPFNSGWIGWWRMNALGVLASVPTLLTWATLPLKRPTSRDLLAILGIVGGITGIVVGVMRGVAPGPTAIMVLYSVLPVALYAAIRFGERGAASAGALATLLVSTFAVTDGGVFATVPLAVRHEPIQILCLTLVSVPLVFGGLIAEREASVARTVQSEDLRKALLGVLPDASYRISADGICRDVFSPLERVTERASERMLGRAFVEAVPTEAVGRITAAIGAAARGERPDPVEYRALRGDDEVFHEARFVTLADSEVLGLVRDITARKHAQLLLAWQAGVLEKVATARPVQEILDQISHAVEAACTRGRSSIVMVRGKQLQVASAPSLPPSYRDLVAKLEICADSVWCPRAAFENRVVIVEDLEKESVSPDIVAAARVFRLRAGISVPIRSSAGTVLGAFSVHYAEPRRPTPFERALAERAAVLAGIAIEREDREDLLASFSRNVNEGLYRATPERGLVYVNQAFARLFGYAEPDQLVAAAASARGDGSAHERDLARLASGHAFDVAEEVRFHRRDGGDFWGLVSSTTVRGPGGHVTSCDGAISDISARKQLEAQLRQAQKLEAVGKLAGGVAHDFNNLLTAVAGYAEAIRDTAPLGSTQRGDAEGVLEATERASALTRQLLAYSRQQVLTPQVLDLAIVVEELGTMLRRVIGEDVSLSIRHEGGAAFVRVDRSQLEQVILNLVVNARDAMPRGGSLTIAITKASLTESSPLPHVDLAPGSYVALCVRDNGIGMSLEVQARAFDPFFTTKEQGKGTGLGLSTVYGIVKQSGGTVWIESEPLSGTVVWIYLPSVAGCDALAPVATRGAEPALRGGSVLVVEDEPLVRDLVSRTLSAAGYEVRTANDGVEALRLAEDPAMHLDLLMTDVVMPRMGGRELVAALAARKRAMPVVFMSGYAEFQGEPSDRAIAEHELLRKPFTSARLLECVRSRLRSALPPRS